MRKIFFVLLISLIISPTFAQGTLGFGCLGLVGGFAGYEIQNFQPTGLNRYVEDFNLIHKDSSLTPFRAFGDTRGFRIGLNLFRRDIGGMIITFKAFYRSLSQKNEAKINNVNGNSLYTLDYESTSFALGADVGTKISQIIDWKIIDVSILFTKDRLTNTSSIPGALSSLKQARSADNIYGFSAGTGFVLGIVPGYITFETTLAYTQNLVDKLQFDDGQFLSLLSNGDVIEKTVDKGGLNVILQLNIGFPF